jgi:hypothetical protein
MNQEGRVGALFGPFEYSHSYIHFMHLLRLDLRLLIELSNE